ncbi:alpha-2-macroglobulin family protein [Algihabitans albus]|uniref:alpha-2-macroglobulin family protein n=1 Tax=Algihabitans albus TaxID=2164067 RepID=UPI000E5CD13C|nr:alpha-2-macroglobulin [Algihabitans albus]
MPLLRRIGIWIVLSLLLAAPPVLSASPEQVGLPSVAQAAERLEGRLAANLEFAAAAGAAVPRDRARVIAELQGIADADLRLRRLEALAGAGLAQPGDWLMLARLYLDLRQFGDAEAAAWLAATGPVAAGVEGAALVLLADILEIGQGGNLRGAGVVDWLAGLPDALLTPELVERRRQLAARYATRFQQVEIDVDRPQPEVCLLFTGRLAQRQALPLTDYLDLAPDGPLDASLRGDRLCLSGLRHGGGYRLTLRPGLLSERGEALEGVVDLEVAVADRTASVGFQAGAYVLPADDDPLLPVTSVNARELDLTLYRVGDRNLLTQLEYGDLGRQLTGYDLQNLAERQGERLWQGAMTVPAGQPNAEQTTLIPLDEMIGSRAPGVYVVVAGVADPQAEDEPWTQQATQWLVVSDLGLSLFEGRDGLTVFARSFADARAESEVELQLVARNNRILGRAVTGPDGRAGFPAGLLRGEGGNRPAALYASTAGGDFTFVDLQGPALDLSERGIAGRPSPGAVDAFLTPERGIYRPGEAVHLTALLRRDSGLALPGQPLTLSVRRSDGVEAHRTIGRDDGLGGYLFVVPLAEAVPTGLWRAEVFLDPEAAPVGAVDFLVEDFVPQRLELSLESDRAALAPPETAEIELEGRWLFGAPAAGLAVQAEAVIDLDPEPFPDYGDWTFGLADEEVSPLRETLPAVRTDAEGESRIAVSLPRLPDSAGPLAARVTVSLFDAGGRPVTRDLKLPLRPRPAEIGLKPRFAEGSIDAGHTAAVDLVALDPAGETLAGRALQVEWIEVRSDWIPYWQNGTRWRRLVTEVPLERETVTTDAQGRALLQRSLDWGDYKLRVVDSGGAATAVTVRAGWRAATGETDVPDALEVTLAEPDLRAGALLEAFVKAPFAGRALVTVLRDEVLHSLEVELPAEGARVALPVEADWGPGAYLAVTAYRPRASASSTGDPAARAPARAMGAAWFTVDRTSRRLEVSLTPPAEVRPRSELTVPLTLRGADLDQGDGRVHLVVAAVDEGVLLVTDFETPDPLEHLFQQRRLGLDLRDLYGKLIDPAEGLRGEVRSGGGAPANLAGLTTRTTEVISLFSGPVQVGPDGTAEVTFQVPDFNGRLRVMAMAWSLGGLGAAAVPVTVRDPLVADLILPRFLALGDRAEATLELNNVAGPAGDYRVSLSAGEAVAVETGASVRLASAARAVLPVPLEAIALGATRVQLVVTGPDGFELERGWNIQVRAAQPYVTRRSLSRLGPGESRLLGPDLTEGFLVEGLDLSVTVSDRPDFGLPGLLASLQRYPYGCVEQTISRALPLVYLPDLAAEWDVALEWSDDRLRTQVRDATASVLARQTAAGGFGLWSAGGGEDVWISAYAADFLSRAQAEGFAVPAAALERAYGYLAAQAGSSWNDDLAGRAYAWQVLARAGRADPGDLRYFAEQQAGALPTPAARLQLAAALAAVGERERATALFALTEEAWQRLPDRLVAWDYGSPLRDAALATALLAESGLEAEAWAAAARVEGLQATRQRLSTQEQLWLLLAARGLTPEEGALAVTLDGRALEGAAPLTLRPGGEDLQEGLTLTNSGSEGLGVTATRVGIPADPLPPSAEGLTIARRLLDFQGQPLDPSTLAQNDQAVVILSGRVTDGRAHQALVVDLLPAGVELESVLAGRGTARDGFAFLPELTRPLYEAQRDDRYVAAVDLSAGETFILAYVVRAVTPGDFALPAPFVEDMYAPDVFARGESGRLAVARLP